MGGHSMAIAASWTLGENGGRSVPQPPSFEPERAKKIIPWFNFRRHAS